MYKKLKIVKIDPKYCNYRRKYDNKIPFNYGKKELRPFIGILFNIEKIEYFAPLSSPKAKHKIIKNTLDILKINDGIYGVINFNNMIPVTKYNYEVFNLNNNNCDIPRFKLMRKQLRWLNANKNDIYAKSLLLYHLYINNKLPQYVKDRCCNFLLLEKKCKYYNSKEILLK